MAVDAPRARLTANDFFAGLFAALRRQGQTTFSVRDDRFDSVVKAVYEWLRARATDENVELRFRVAPHPMYGDSRTVRRALSAAAQRQVISFDNPEYLDVRITLDENEATRLLDSLPVRAELFDELATQFVRSYRGQPTSVS